VLLLSTYCWLSAKQPALLPCSSEFCLFVCLNVRLTYHPDWPSCCVNGHSSWVSPLRLHCATQSVSPKNITHNKPHPQEKTPKDKPPYLLSTSAYYYQQYHNLPLISTVWTLHSIAAVVTTGGSLPTDFHNGVYSPLSIEHCPKPMTQEQKKMVPKVASAENMTWEHLQPRHAGMHPVHDMTTEFPLADCEIHIILFIAHPKQLYHKVDLQVHRT